MIELIKKLKLFNVNDKYIEYIKDGFKVKNKNILFEYI